MIPIQLKKGPAWMRSGKHDITFDPMTDDAIGPLLEGYKLKKKHTEYPLKVRVDEYNVKVVSLTETIQAITAKQLADQESNLKDVEENKLVDDRVKALEAIVIEQETKIVELQTKKNKKK